MELNGAASGLDEKLGVRSESTSDPSTPEELNGKVSSILDACRLKDIGALRELATSKDGLCSDDLRRQACSYYTEMLLLYH